MGKGERNAPRKNEVIKFEFTKDAFADLVESIDWYESQQSNLGIELAANLYFELQFILEFPKSSRKINNELRRKVMKKFPFNIYYSYYEENFLIEVIGILHESRNPNIWKERIN
ncbi:MAG: type II toxin-antitoxin system RelE/ParE family toxin [Bacteroidota bacterium]|nr:type II toxin-antitoxin system RelE/ParE family toxin [Bacteroidota bacterium]